MLLLLLAASLLSSHQAQMTRIDAGANVAATQTEPVYGPDDLATVLKVSAADDHSKNSHECSANYQLDIARDTGAPAVVNIPASVSDAGMMAMDGRSG